MSVSLATGLLTLEEAAAALNTSPLHVQRLIARGVLKATLLAADVRATWSANRLRVTADEVRRYSSIGAPDFTAPDFHGDWLADVEENRLRTNLETALSKACEEQMQSDAKVLAEYNARIAKLGKYALSYDVGAAQSVDVDLRATPAVMAAANKPITSGPDWMQRKYRTAFQAVAVSYLRSAAKRFIEERQTGSLANRVATLSKLYSPEYPAIAAGSLALLKTWFIVVFSHSTVIADGPQRGSYIRTTYKLPFSSFDISKVAQDAF